MGLMDAAGKLVELSKGLASLEAQKALLDVMEQCTEAQRRIAELEARVRELEADVAFKTKLVHRDNAAWTADGDGPFCSRCVTVLGKPVRLVVRDDGYRRCPECKDLAQGHAWDTRSRAATRRGNERLGIPPNRQQW